MKPEPILRYGAIAAAVLIFGSGCNPTVSPDPTESELIRQLVDTGDDETILFSSAILFDQTGTDQFNRTVDSVRREYTNLAGPLANGFDDDSVETQTTRKSFQANIVDRLWGTITFKVGLTSVTRPFSSLAYAGRAKFLKIGSWTLWRLEHRNGFQRAGDGSPDPQSIVVASGTASQELTEPVLFREFRDSLITLTMGALSSLTVTVVTDSPNDSFFVTYPVAGGYETTVMNHTDSITHVATVDVQSSRRYELLAIQGFKSEALRDTMYAEALATTIQTAMIAFR